jgi:methionyl-tRNA formyltransferase
VSVVAFGDTVGLPRLLRLLPAGSVLAAVMAGVRPAQREALEVLCADAGVPLLVQPRRDDPGHGHFVQSLERLDPDLILVDSYSMLLAPEVLAVARHTALNVHGALLPQYRGANPTQWALLNDERETGVTIHVMSAEFDAGDIVAQRRVPIRFGDTWVDIHARIAEATEALLVEQLPGILAGDYERHPQDPAFARHFRRRTPEDGRIDWDASVLAIYNLVRALVAPNPGASYRDGEATVVLDRYLTVSEVAALKYGRAGRRSLGGLVPLGDGGNERVLLAVEGGGSVAVADIDWDRRRARLTADMEAARAFAEQELGLSLVS